MGVRVPIFIVVMIALAFFSRASLRTPRSHGFVRFFLFLVILAMVLIQAPTWFKEAGAWHQVISWILLCTSLVPLFLGLQALHAHGGIDMSARTEPELLGFEHTSRLVTSGIYGTIRHPMYSSLLLLTWGVFFKDPSFIAALLAIFATALLFVMARIEEAECQRVFGEEYQAYMRQTKRFLPHAF